jgi:ABC-type hemin transport system ATPase subunit
VQPLRFELDGHRSCEGVSFECGPVTVLFGKNNAGKTNILEAIDAVLAQQPRSLRRPVSGRDSSVDGGLWVRLEPGVSFDETTAAGVGVDLHAPGVHHVRFMRGSKVAVGDPLAPTDVDEDGWPMDPRWDGVFSEPVASAGLHVVWLDWQYENLHEPFASAVASLARTERQAMRRDDPWLEMASSQGGEFVYRVPARTEAAVTGLAQLASDLLPDFVEGAIRAHVTVPSLWTSMPRVIVEFEERGATQCADVVELAGSGAARWMSAAIQLAIHLAAEHDGLTALRGAEDVGAGHVILLDEPEAHLHPAAVASVVRWCRRMARHGFTVVVASHHEEFLREAAVGDITLVHVTRDADLVSSSARTLTAGGTATRLELAQDVGLHPAAALSIHRAVLFVEGPLDVAVLDEYAGLRLDAAGVMLIPIHGTKNLEGLVSAEVVQRLGLRVGILTDATVIDTLQTRRRKELSSEEKKVLRIVELARSQGLPDPAVFGVPEADLLFAIPVDGVQAFTGKAFPGWKQIVNDARAAAGADPSTSVNWKKWAWDEYGLPITDPSGVREIVRFIDLNGFNMPSVGTVIDDIEKWARS